MRTARFSLRASADLIAVTACLLGAGALALACGGGSDGGSGSSTTSTSSGTGGGGGGGPQPIHCDSEPATGLALDGTWAAYGRLSVTLAGVPGGAITICPADQIGEATLLMLVTIQQNATDPTKLDAVKATLCSIELPVVTALVGDCNPSSDTLVSTQIVAPKSFIDALPKIATTSVTGTLGGTADGSSLSLDRFTVTMGTSKSGASMPSWNTVDAMCNTPDLGRTTACETTCVADCVSMRDDDADGYPGMTMDVCGMTPSDTMNNVKCNADTPNDPGATIQGRGFLNFEVDPLITGTAKSSCELTGTVDSPVLYNLVGADVYLAGSPITVTSAIKSLPTFQVDPTLSKARMIRIDGKYGAPDWKVDATQPAAACATVNMNVNAFQ